MIVTMVMRGVRRASGVAALAALSLAAVFGVPTADGQTIGTPDVSGDQLIFLYDARTDRVAFLSVANPSDDTIFLDVALYNADLSAEIAGQTVSLEGAANIVIDPTSFAGGGANGNAGLAVITPVISMDDLTPIVPPERIVGGFTLANLQLSSGFGQNPFARLAVDGSGSPAAAGTTVNGTTVAYERFDPGILTIPVYFDPATLAPPENDGNRVLLAAFADDYDGAYGLSAVSTSAAVTFLNSSGERIVSANSVPISGVLLSNLQSVAGGADIDGASGKVFFEVSANGGNVFGLFSQSIGTFAAGQRMPAAEEVPMGVEPTMVPTPTPTPTGGPIEPPPTGACAATITLEFDGNAVPDLSGILVELRYPAGATLPGSRGEDAVLGAVSNLTGVSGGLFNVSDQDDDAANAFVNIGLVAIPGPIPPGPFAVATFNPCSATASDFSCVIESASNLLGTDVSGQIGCTIALD